MIEFDQEKGSESATLLCSLTCERRRLKRYILFDASPRLQSPIFL